VLADLDAFTDHWGATVRNTEVVVAHVARLVVNMTSLGDMEDRVGYLQHIPKPGAEE
jgi:hypothetical protein